MSQGHATAARVDALLSDEWRLLVVAVALEAAAVVGYFGLTGATITDPRYVLYPFVWINVGLVAVARTDLRAAAPRHRWLALGVAGAYFLVLAYLTGLVGLYLGGHGAHSHSHIHGLQVTMSPPGWGPRVAYVTHVFHVYFVPYRVLGYLALAYLLYAAIVDATTTAAGGALGLVSCVGCAFPLVSSAAAAVGGAAVVGAVTALSTDLSTAVFVVAVALLAWRPGGEGGSDRGTGA